MVIDFSRRKGSVDTAYEHVNVRLTAYMTSLKVNQLLTAILPYPMIGLRHQSLHLGSIMCNAKLPDFPEAALALVYDGNADTA